MNWGRLTSGNPGVTHTAITICLVIAGYLAVVPMQREGQLLRGILLVDTMNSIAIQEDINDWIVSEGDSIQAGQIIGYTLPKLQRQLLETLMTIGSLDRSLAIEHIRDILDSGALAEGPSKSWIESHLIQSDDRSTIRVIQRRPNRLPEFNQTLADVDQRLAQLRARRLNQDGSDLIEADLVEMNALEKEQMKLRQQINVEILRSEQSARPAEKQSRWTLNAPLDSLGRVAKSEFEQAQVVAKSNGRLTKIKADATKEQYLIASHWPLIATLELEPGSALDPSENGLIKMNLRDKKPAIQNRSLSGRIVDIQYLDEKIRLTLAFANQEDIFKLSSTTEVHIQSDVPEQMTIYGLLTSREL